jgi:lysophospholipid acyltransferase (LPLAT)-like uncharacterized protein
MTLTRYLKTRLKTRWFITQLARTAGLLLAAIKATWRPVLLVHPAVEAMGPTQPVIYAVWHGRMFGLLSGVNPAVTALLISASNDGDFITQAVAPLGFTQVIRGSSMRQGAHAIRHLITVMKQQRLSVAITVDGPRGPRYMVKPNLAQLAARLNVPIVPLIASARPLLFWQRRAWDHYMGPHLFSRQAIVVGQPLWPSQTPSPDEVTTLLEQRLLDAHQTLDTLFEHHHYWQCKSDEQGLTR